MKIVSHTLQAIGGIEIYPIISFFIFMTLFAGIMFFVIKASKKSMDEMAAMPLDSDTDLNNN